MRRLTSIGLLLAPFLVTTAVHAMEQWDGEWIMTSISLDVTTSSWGDNCGERPKSYSNTGATKVDIKEQAGQLIFSTGGIRTDSCASPNSKMKTISSSTSSTTWTRVCQTPNDDPKFEHGTYTLNAINKNRLEYSNLSRFDWSLKGDHCVASSRERRVYIRHTAEEGMPEPSKTAPVVAPVVPPDSKSQVGEPGQETLPECEKPGPVKQLVVSPARARIRSGEQVCFKALATDENNCQIDVEPFWTATQNGKIVPRLISQSGCLHAGETAADAEGEYIVTAKSNGKSGSAGVSVVFPDLGDLLAARLKPLEDGQPVPDNDEDKPPKMAATPTLPAIPTAPSLYTATPKRFTSTTKAQGEGTWWLSWLLGAAVVAVVGFAIYWIIFHIRRQRHHEKGGESDDWSEGGKNAESFGSDIPQEKAKRANEQRRCPKCLRVFEPGARYCPYDKNALEKISNDSKSTDVGMICPKCHRWYNSDARFCPHDSQTLVPYIEWRGQRYAEKWH